MDPPPDLVHVGLGMPPDLVDAIRQAALREDRTLSSFIRTAVRAALEAGEHAPPASAKVELALLRQLHDFAKRLRAFQRAWFAKQDRWDLGNARALEAKIDRQLERLQAFYEAHPRQGDG